MRLDIHDVATVKEETENGKVIVEFEGVDQKQLQDLVTECSSGVCSCGSEEFLANVDAFTLSKDGKTIEISGKVSADEVTKTLENWQKDL